MRTMVEFNTNKGIETHFKETKLGNTGITIVRECAEDIELFNLEPLELDSYVDLSTEDISSFLASSKNKIKEFIQFVLKQLNKIYLYIRKLIFNLLRIGSSLEDVIEPDKRYYNFYCDGLIMEKCQTLINIDSDIYNNFDNIIDIVTKQCVDVIDKCKLALENHEVTFSNIKDDIFSITNKEIIKFIDGKIVKTPLIKKDFYYEHDAGGNCVRGKEILNKLSILKDMKNNKLPEDINSLKEYVKKLDNNDNDLNKIMLYSVTIPNIVLSMFNSVHYELYTYLRLLAINGDRDNDNNPLKDIL